VKAVVRSAKKTPQYLRIEFEDHSGSATVFADRNTELATRDYVYALIGDRTLHAFCDAYNFIDTPLYNFVMLRKQGDNHKFAWLRNTGLGFVGDEKTLMYVLNARVFKTSKGKDMANMYCWDGRNIFKIVVFPHIVRKVKPLIKSDEWFAVRLDKIEDKNSLSRLDSYKLSSDSAIITVNNYIDRKNLVVPT
jgi:hypothetical protein